jgi:tetratricopeptide (TPR) repeat protein
MTIEREHDLVPTIRAWLEATSDVEILTGLSREDACQRACCLITGTSVQIVPSEAVESDDDLKDIAWAAIAEFREKPFTPQAFLACDRLYRLVSSLQSTDDQFGEIGEILRDLATTGWCATPGGLEAVDEARSAIWRHDDEIRHRKIWESADELPQRIQAMGSQCVLRIEELHEICARLVKLSGICPAQAAASASVFIAILQRPGLDVGWLDDRAYVKAVAIFASAMAQRQLGGSEAAERGYREAASILRCTASSQDLDRIEVEGLALLTSRGDHARVIAEARRKIGGLRIPRERIKAQTALANSLLNQGQAREALIVLESTQRESEVTRHPGLRAWMLTILGNALSYEGRDVQAVAAFNEAGSILASYYYPVQLGNLAGALGEHLGKLGNLREAAALFGRARDIYHQIDEPNQVAYFAVLRAEMLVLLGRTGDAGRELFEVLPLIEHLDLRKEGIAAVALLREAVSKQRADVKTIRRLRDQLPRGEGG